MGYAVHGVFGVLLTSLEFIFSPVTDPGSLQSLNTFWKQNSGLCDWSLEMTLSFFLRTIGRQSVKNAYEPHLSTDIAQIFPPLPTAFRMGKRTTKQALQKFALNEFLLESGFRHVFWIKQRVFKKGSEVGYPRKVLYSTESTKVGYIKTTFLRWLSGIDFILWYMKWDYFVWWEFTLFYD